MSFGRSIVLVASGVVAGIAFVLSCSDAPGKADAATCDCPAAEPPLTASRYQVVSNIGDVPANGTGGQSVRCPTGTLFLSGSCTTQLLNPVRDVTLQQSGFYEASELGVWACSFRNNEATPVNIQATVVCLKPAP
ncbi:MAG: hypothetical protein KF773_12385 [Deltaproteobacteria bacterium]|nr:hypothetical protein [Deltaproteobacteria bacterium]